MGIANKVKKKGLQQSKQSMKKTLRERDFPKDASQLCWEDMNDDAADLGDITIVPLKPLHVPESSSMYFKLEIPWF